ncbi:MAG: N-acetylmuramoyl-L-alanine amidase, partial [Clostridia bacterium]|nr:N-acetylmuramoyl-L-alanine amidase [Clostridia bacterium]
CDTKNQDYRITDYTCSYIDITFCYATVFKNHKGGKLPFTVSKDDPVFKSVKLIKNKSDCTLRLTFKKKGGFYGWDASYNKNGELCFDFLIPRTIESADNDYGVDLNGAVVLLDVGHGGKDPGAGGLSPKKHNEAIQNLILANKIKAELEKIGANVVMTRTGNTTCASDQKLKILRDFKPDYCLAIHHDSSTSSSQNGFCAYYFQPISKNAANYIKNETAKTKSTIYKKVYGLKWHTYYMVRSTACPVVLTENGYISNSFDYKNIISDKQNTLKAKSLTQGIVDYFKAIQ